MRQPHLAPVVAIIVITFVSLALLGHEGLLALVARYAWLQLSQHEEFVTRSESNRIKLRPVAPARGLVYDRNGVLLADNRPAFRIEVVPERVADLEATLSGLAGLLVLDDDDLERFRVQYAAARRFQPVPLKFNLGEEEMARFAVNQHRFPGVDVVSYHSRHYVHGALYSHIIGYVGRIDADGYLTIVGRSKDLIISGGYNVYPAEVESYINSMDGVAESALVGVPHPDFGEVGVAVVTARPGATPDAQAIIAALKARLANFKVPKRCFVVDGLPRNTMGKVQKNLLREQYQGLFVPR